MPSLNILFYTDHESVSLPYGDHGVSTLKQLLETRKPAFLDALTITVMNRFEDPQNPHKFTGDLLKGFHEVWIFGKHQANVNGAFSKVYGGPENEPDDDEVRALAEWMKTGGVLMTGDHSQINLPNDGTDPKKIYCRGKALGYRVPRARELRIWEGRPTNNPDLKESFNTLVKVGEKDPDTNPELQRDKTPQKIELALLGLASSPHPIFLGMRQTIDILPDHMHEGAVDDKLNKDSDESKKVEELIGKEWPEVNGKTQEPVIIAYGFDKRSLPPTRGAVVAVYDGDPVSVGRIVADSSWHHYINENLRRLADSGDDSDLDLMAQFYSNLVVWLAPLEIRKEMAHAMFNWLATHPDVEEEIGNSTTRIGAVGLYYLSKFATQCQVNELIQAVSPSTPQDADGMPLMFPSERDGATHLPSQELVLGSVVEQFQRRVFTVTPLETSDVAPDPILSMSDEALAANGLVAAYRLHADKINEIASSSRRNLDTFMRAIKNVPVETSRDADDLGTEGNSLREDKIMACEIVEGTWIYSRFVTDGNEEVVHDGTIRIDRPNASGEFTGVHLESGDPIEGRCFNEAKPRIELKRTHANRTVTEYKGKVASYPAADRQVIIKGRFKRTTPGDERALDLLEGDWETEKPT